MPATVSISWLSNGENSTMAPPRSCSSKDQILISHCLFFCLSKMSKMAGNDPRVEACLSAATLFFLAFNSGVVAKGYGYPSPCGDGLTIRFPFRFKGDPPGQGDSRYELDCKDNHTILSLNGYTYHVEEISYENRTVRIVEPGLADGNCSYLPRYPRLERENFYFYAPVFDYYYSPVKNTSFYYFWPRMKYIGTLVFVNCSKPVDDGGFSDATPCINDSNTSSPQWHVYFLLDDFQRMPEWCYPAAMVPIELQEIDNRSIVDVYKELRTGFPVEWAVPECESYIKDDGVVALRCTIPRDNRSFLRWMEQKLPGFLVYSIVVVVCIMVARIFCGIIFMFAALIYQAKRRYLGLDPETEEFLRSYTSATPSRYSYSEIKKMTRGFKNKLGQGGFGSVFKGMLADGRLVAVKILRGSKGNGQDFINEVATIGRIHHLNVVQLIGFCCTRTERALIYDFMPNGSLDKYIFAPEGKDSPLSWEKMYDIALGVARGIAYLHQGCAMKILHFDIKPHNILLDKNLIPKVSDFGTAKFCQTDNSAVSLSAPRGTIGYMAPELFYRNVGGVSHKSDVYSFGMLLLEIAGRRKRVHAFTQDSSEFYFPSWIYDRISCGGEMEMGTATDDEKQMAKKLITVALWCIQMNPHNRPSMSKVIDWLEGSVDLMQIPPKPFSSSPEQDSIEDFNTISSTIELEEP